MATSISGATSTIRIASTPTGEWVIEAADDGPSGAFASEGLAFARVLEWARGRPGAELDLIIESASGTSLCHLSFTKADPLEARRHIYEDAEDERLSHEAAAKVPSWEQIQAIKAKLPPSTIDFSLEDDELPC